MNLPSAPSAPSVARKLWRVTVYEICSGVEGWNEYDVTAETAEEARRLCAPFRGTTVTDVVAL